MCLDFFPKLGSKKPTIIQQAKNYTSKPVKIDFIAQVTIAKNEKRGKAGDAFPTFYVLAKFSMLHNDMLIKITSVYFNVTFYDSIKFFCD